MDWWLAVVGREGIHLLGNQLSIEWRPRAGSAQVPCRNRGNVAKVADLLVQLLQYAVETNRHGFTAAAE